ncbi:hypothetical protein ACFMBG_23875 [Leisingera sp. D0M16]|uniref:hypothetical protein n=1 Tax=Leisingera coralii TaxID=3351347 RepID=UPI003B8011FB
MGAKAKIGFWQKARVHFDAAKKVLNADDDEAPRYAALRLRMALECIAYDCAQAADLTPSEIGVWQPGKAIKILKSMDPHVDQSRTISIGPERTGENAVGELKTVGSDVRLTARRMDKINGNLGQLLHEASLLDHLSGRALEPEEVLNRVQKVIGEMEPIFSQRVMKLHINENVNLPCECGETMTRRVASLDKDGNIWCDNCGAIYFARQMDGQWEFKRRIVGLTCPACSQSLELPGLLEREGSEYRCTDSNCGAKIRCVVGLHWVVEERQA